jgi:hypothetical protein
LYPQKSLEKLINLFDSETPLIFIGFLLFSVPEILTYMHYSMEFSKNNKTGEILFADVIEMEAQRR